ncbi:HD domain-containing protein [Lacrimispora sp. AGF001]|uniref:HD domain-containing protein n=1 Tax=Lacrimispora sp. AGF001 TaxID=3401631 RepID=UPI003B42B658
MREDILNYLCEEVEQRCKLPTNHFGMGCYYHIQAVVKNAEILADSCNADKEVVLISAWLHDIASITDYGFYEDHHIHGAEMAEDILHKFNYSPDKIKLIQQCIRNHRGVYRIQELLWRNYVLQKQMLYLILIMSQVYYI